MSVTIQPFGEKAKLYTLENKNGTRLTVTDIGACTVSLIFCGTDIALGWDDAEGYFRGTAYLGATVGRSCNRIAGGAFSINGVAYRLAANDGENNLHSGPDGYETRIWETAETTEDSVTFFMDSPDGDQGYPGHLKLWASYRLTEDDRVFIDYRGVSDKDTIINITNHTYFNLNGQGNGDIHGHILRLHASRITPARPGLIPTGEIADVAGTPFDFTDGHPVGRDIEARDPALLMAGGYDHNYLLDGEGMRTAAELIGDKTGITLTVLTDRPALQFYSGNSLPGQKGKGGAVYARRGALCLETQQVPNAVNEPAFPSPIVKAGEKYEAHTVWQLKKNGASFA